MLKVSPNPAVWSEGVFPSTSKSGICLWAGPHGSWSSCLGHGGPKPVDSFERWGLGRELGRVISGKRGGQSGCGTGVGAPGRFVPPKSVHTTFLLISTMMWRVPDLWFRGAGGECYKADLCIRLSQSLKIMENYLESGPWWRGAQESFFPDSGSWWKTPLLRI